jgi:hypothetical protein
LTREFAGVFEGFIFWGGVAPLLPSVKSPPFGLRAATWVGVESRREKTTMSDLQVLIEAARLRPISEDEREAQRRSFAYGNTKIENDRITREMVDQQDELLKLEAREGML